MSRHKHTDFELKATLALTRRRSITVLACLKVLCPSADPRRRRDLANRILMLVDGKDRVVPKKTVTPSALYEMITRNSQCVLNYTGRCPLLVFSQQLSAELNEFSSRTDGPDGIGSTGLPGRPAALECR